VISAPAIYPRNISYWFLCLFCGFLAFAAASKVHGTERQRAKRVLIVSTGSRFSSFPVAEGAIVDRLRELHAAELEFNSEYLDIVRFPNEQYQRLFRGYLRDKYARDLPDLVVFIFVGKLGTAGDVFSGLFPKAPLVVAGLTEEELPARLLPGRVAGIAQRSDPRGTIELIFRLQPEIRRIVLIGGTADVDRHVMSRAQEVARGYAGRAEFEVWDKRSMPEILKAVSSLPRQTAILFTRMFRDGGGAAVNSSQAARSIAKVSSVPVYIMTDTMLGTGAVGGSAVDLVSLGRRAGEVAYRILSGAEPKSMPLEILTRGVPIFDWQALKRWGISESRLPKDSVVRSRPLSIWEQYKSYIIAALIIIVIQALMILDLLLQRRRRRRAESKQQEIQEIMELAASAGELGLWMRDPKRGEFWANPQFRSLLGPGTNGALKFEDVINLIHPDERSRVAAEVDRAEQMGLPYGGEFRVVLADGSERWVAARGRNVNERRGRDTRRVGVVLDITERKRAEEQLRQSEDNFRRLVETTAAVIWQADVESWMFTYVTPQAVKLLGYPLERWYEKDFWVSHIHPDDRERAINTCLTMSKSTGEFDFEYRMTNISGEIVWVHDIVNCQHQDGQPFQLRGLMVDITERKRSEQALRESEARFRTVANSAPVMIWLSGFDKGCTFFNKGWLDFTGRTLEQELGNGWMESVHCEDIDHCRETYVKAFDARQEFTVEYRLRAKGGEYCWVLDHGVPRFEADGAFLGYIGTALDISEAKRSAERLNKERAFLRQVIDVDPNFIFAKDREGRFTLANRAVAEAYGTTVEDLVGKTDADFNSNAQELEFFRRVDQEVIDTNQERFIPEERITDARGNLRWLQTVKRPIIMGDGNIIQMLGSATDITERKRAEEKFRVAVEASPNAFVMVDQRGEIILVNALTEKLFGYDRDELIGQPVEMLVPERFRDGHPAHRRGFFASPQARAMGAGRDLFARRKDGGEFLVEIGLNPIQTAEGVFVLTAIVDITERKRAEAELQRNREELAHVTRVSALGELAASLAHELNQPLTAILSNAQAAQRFLSINPTDLEEIKDILKDIVEDNSRAGEVIRRMRALVKKEDLAFEVLDLTGVVRDVIQLVHSDAILRNVRVSFEANSDLPSVRGDRVQLQQVVLNLLLNAFEAMKDTPMAEREVVVQVKMTGLDALAVAVRDQGTGMTSEKFEKIFQPFFTTKKEGLGMGLSISRSIIEAHGGQLWAENNTDRGATFYITVPVGNILAEERPPLSHEIASA
jgi:PAS domain S-box-containing protein